MMEASLFLTAVSNAGQDRGVEAVKCTPAHAGGKTIKTGIIDIWWVVMLRVWA